MTQESRGKILIVDDDPDAVEFVKTVMEVAGYEAVDAANGVQGLEKAREELPCLAILDVQMPEKDGFSMFVEMRQDPQLKDIPVIMLTGVSDRTGIHFTASEMGDYLGEEPDAYVEKPVDPEVLQETVQKVLGG